MSQKYLCLGEFLKIKYLVQKILILADPEDYFSGLIDMKNSYLLDIIKEVRDKIKPEYFQKK
jgi:hypothetical protein